MQTTSAPYKRLLADPNHKKEVKASIAGVEYGQDDIRSCAVSHGLFSEISVGQCISGELDLIIQPKGEIPRMARIDLFIRLTLGDEVSEWIPKGIYFIDTRGTDEAGGQMTIHGYDAMMKTEIVWTPAQALVFPMTMPDAVREITNLIGVAVDGRTILNAVYTIDYPANDYTLREVLGYIAAAHAGNWTMTDKGKLLLVPLLSTPPETSFLVDEAGDALLFGGVRLLV